MGVKVDFSLSQWVIGNSSNAAAVIGGSATPSLSLKEIISLSSDPKTTEAAFQFNDKPLGLGTAQGDLDLRKTIAAMFDTTKSSMSASHVVVTNSATGANHVAFRSLLEEGDHVLCQYPTYGPLIEEPIAMGCDLSYVRLNANHGQPLDLEGLKRMIKPGKTKILVLNNPTNPTGTYLSSDMQRDIIKIAKEHDISIHCDEIFRPLFHTDEAPPSFMEHADLGYDKIYVTGSLSKAYGLSGIRIGWVVTRSPELHAEFMYWRQFAIGSTSQIDEAIATEVLGPRCRPGILKKHLNLARTNLDLMQEFIDKHPDQVEWSRPTAGAVALVKFKDHKTGKSIDDVDFCKRLFEKKGVLISSATKCFEFGGLKEEVQGRARMHFTTQTETVKKGLKLLGEFLDEERASEGVNGLAL